MQKIVSILGLMVALSGVVQAQNRTIDIPAQNLSEALHSLSSQTGIQLLFTVENLQDIRSQAVSGSMSPEHALAHLLRGTACIYLASEKDTYVIKKSGGGTTPSKSMVLPEVTVRDYTNPGSPYNTQYIRPNTSTATKTNTPVMETPFSVQSLPRQVLQDQQAIRLDSVLQNVSGVTQMPTNQGGSDGFLIRGFSSDTTYRNGVFMPNSLGGGTVKREMANIEEIQVLKGPGSILFGRADPGGIINTVTKQPLATPYYSLQQQAGSFDFYRTKVDATGPLTKDDRLLYRFNLSYENSASFRDFVNTRSVFIAPVVRFNISPQTQITAELEYQSFKNVADPGIPNRGNRPADVPRNLFSGEPINNRNPGDRYFIGVNWSHMLNMRLDDFAPLIGRTA
ncbi:MAG: TonB-dependent receptor [Nitrosomonas sp.]|nr:MAG: TonB-dependent receptor [Nitrosomonas sp.]